MVVDEDLATEGMPEKEFDEETEDEIEDTEFDVEDN